MPMLVRRRHASYDPKLCPELTLVFSGELMDSRTGKVLNILNTSFSYCGRDPANMFTAPNANEHITLALEFVSRQICAIFH
jgi:hypothetical protein